MKPPNNLLFVASTVKGLATGPITGHEKVLVKIVASHHKIIHVETLQFVSAVKGTTNPLQTLVQPLLLFLKTLPSPIKVMKILQLNITSLQTSHNQLKFYQEQNDYDVIAPQETSVKDKL